MATTRGQFAQLLAPGLHDIIYNDLTVHPEEYSQTFIVGPTSRAYEEDVLMAGLGAVPVQPEGEVIKMDDPIQGGSYRYTPQSYGLGFQVTYQMYDDDQYGKIKTVASNMSRSIKQTVESTAANVLTNGFTNTTGTITIDGVTLYNTAHPLLGGSTYSNRAATDISLSVTGLQEINNLFERMVDERGLLLQSMPTMLLIPPELQYTAGEILNSAYKPNTGNNDVNVMQGRLEPYINHYLTSHTAWFVFGEKRDHWCKFFWRQQPKFESQDDFFTGGANFKVQMRFAVGAPTGTALPHREERNMPITNFPAGLSSFGVPLIGNGGSLGTVTTGLVFFVNSATGNNSAYNSSSGQGTDPTQPFATIDYAIGQCPASSGATIYVMPGHTETISGAAGIACDVIGITIIGLGNGSNRPLVTFSQVASTWTISAANVTVKNIVVTCTLATTKMFSITAANAVLDTIDYVEGAGIPLQFVLTSAAADGLTIQNCTHYAATAGAGAQLWIQLVGVDTPHIVGNKFFLTLFNGATTAAINATTASIAVDIRGNVIWQVGGTTQAAAILMAASTTGFITDNRCAVGSTGLPGIVAAANCYCAENYAVNTVNKSGILDPVADS